MGKAVRSQRPRVPGSFPPGQSLTPATALTAYTAGSARINHDDDAGTIVPGNRADLVVLDRAPFTEPAADIWRTKVAMTFLDGQEVYRR
ncbi:amidohydrolase family protein [Streptosporangium sp. NPDC023963]|uniref:amidohydrolase family protein n=1 Tax=Streptosporangium sp. NPDC023963 TaxID=3155608 RepID=UPI003415D9A6